MASSSYSSRVKKYDVFLSFRGVDTRRTFVSHLYQALDHEEIFTFRDDQKIEAGDNISDQLIQAIHTSWFAVVVISENYATSKWCLEELRLIMKLYSKVCIKVVPIFCGVEPSNVRYQTGSFEAAFQRYTDLAVAPERVVEWRRALNQDSDLSGLNSSTSLDDASMISKLVGKISSELQTLKPTGLINLVGMEAHMETMNRLLDMESNDEVHMIGIWGMSGIGKTSIARYLYNQISLQFPAHRFIQNNIDKICKEQGPSYLRSILGGNQKVLVVLDGVDNVEHLQTLAQEMSQFCPGSRIIITTRDWGLLNSCGVKLVYEVKCLDDKDSLQAFEKLVFGERPPPSDGFQKLFIRASQLAHGLPFALKAYASHFSGNRTIEEWEDELRLLETSPLKNVEDILKKSYEDLSETYQTAFLHVACLFNGYPVSHVTSLLVNGRPRINHILWKSLISISTDWCIKMHVLVVQTGLKIVREESKDMPSRQRILWDPNEIYDVLRNKQGTSKIEGMTLHTCKMHDTLPMNASVFSATRNLQFLEFFQHLGDPEANLKLNSNCLHFPHKLRLLHWDAYQLNKWPSSLELNHLVELNLRYSNLTSLWAGTEDLHSLRRLDVTGSRNRGVLPYLSTVINLEELMIEGCTRLDHIPESIRVVHNLKKLNAIHCDILRGINFTIKFIERGAHIMWCLEFPSTTVWLELLTDLFIEGQIDIQMMDLHGNAEQIKLLNMSENAETGQRMAPENNISLNSLQSLHIKRFSYRNPPVPFRCYSFQLFPCLTELKLINFNISTIPDNINRSELLRKIDLSGNDFVYLPTTMQSLANLRYLSLRNCPKLTSLPQLTQVETLILSDCVNLQTLLQLRANEEHRTHRLLELWLDNCRSAKQLSDALTHFNKLTYLDLSRHEFVTLPSSIKELSSLGSLFVNNCKRLKSLEELPLSLKHLYAQGCDSLENVSLSTDHALKHIDLKDCPLMKQDEQLKNLFSNDGYVQEVSPRFSTLSRTGEANHFENEHTWTTTSMRRIRQPSIWTTLTGNCFKFLQSLFGRH